MNNMPQVEQALEGWTVQFYADYKYQVQVDGEFVDVDQKQKIEAVWQPLKTQEILLKPEGQRNWDWQQMHVNANAYLPLMVGQRIYINNVYYKVMAKKDYSLNGYYEYHVVRDFGGNNG